jgi:hypothetical protein
MVNNEKTLKTIFIILLIICIISLFILNGSIWLVVSIIFWIIFSTLIWLYIGKYLLIIKKSKKFGVKWMKFCLILTLYISTILLFSLVMIPITYIRAEFNDGELDRIVNEMIKNCKTDEEKTIALLNWFERYSGNIYNTYGSIDIGPIYFSNGDIFDSLICVRIIERRPALWVLTSRCGACGEHSALFKYMANKADLTVRSVVCDGIDHAWNEVKIHGNWTIVDPANVVYRKNMSGYNLAPESYEKGHASRTRNISYVFAEDINYIREDITNRYTNLSHINITTVDKNLKPISDVEISVFSYNKFEKGADTKLTFKTDKNGNFQLNIGGGDVKFVSRKGGLIALYGEKRSYFLDDENYDLKIVLERDWVNSYLFFLFLFVLIFLFIVLIIRKFWYDWFYQKLIIGGFLVEKHRHELILTLLSFIIILFINFITGGGVFTLVLVLFFIFPLLIFLYISYPKKYNKVIVKYISKRFRNKKIAILDGRVNENQSMQVKVPKQFFYNMYDWKNNLERLGLVVETIPSSKISDKYSMIINPLGATYIEEDITNFTTLKNIHKYIKNGGVFINCGDLAFWRSWNSKDVIEGFTSPLVTTYALDSSPLKIDLFTYFIKYQILKLQSVVDAGTSLIDTWLYRNFGIRTTLGSPRKNLAAMSKKDYLRHINGFNVNEFRAALNCEREDSIFIPLISVKLDKLNECYPVAAVHQKIGYLILFGLEITSRGCEFELIIKTIKQLHERYTNHGQL